MLLISTGTLIAQGLLLGLGLTMDACAVSMTNGLQEPKMKNIKMTLIAFAFAFFQALMPLIGYFCGNIFYTNFPFIEKYKIIPILALIILVFLGTKMIIESIKESKNLKNYNESEAKEVIKKIGVTLILSQAVATSIDALSTGLTFSNLTVIEALIEVALIAIVTFIFSFISIIIGKKVGDKLGSKAILIGGFILICIGIEIFVTGLIS